MIGGGNEAARLYVSVGADIAKAMSGMKAIDQSVNRAAASVKRANPILEGIGAGFGINLTNMAAQAGRAVVNFAFESIEAASDLRESFALTDQVFEENSATMQRWAAGAAEEFGQSQREALDFASGFGTAFKNVGMDIDDASAKSKTLTRLAADLGSAFNRSSAEAATALRSGLLGESEPLRRFGVFLSEAAVQAKAVEIGIARAGQELSDTQKVAARYAIILDQTADSQGMFGRDTESLVDAQAALAAEMENLQAEIGAELLPLMRDLAVTVREDVVPAIRAIPDAIEDVNAALPFLEGMPDIFTAAASAGGGVNVMFGEQVEAARAAAEAHLETAAAIDAGRHHANRGGEAMEDLGDDARRMSERVRVSNDDIIASFQRMRDRLTEVASGAADSIYGPLIARGQLAATEREIAEQREITAASESTAAQIADAKTRIAELSATKIEQLALLASFGDEAAAQALVSNALLTEALFTGTEEQKASIMALRQELALLQRAADEAAKALTFGVGIRSGVSGDRVGPLERAHGGPVDRDEVYWVGERGPELYVPDRSGTIIPNDELATGGRHEMQVPAAATGWDGGRGASTSAAGGGGPTYQYITVKFEGPVLDPYGDFTQRFAEQLQPALARATSRAGA